MPKQFLGCLPLVILKLPRLPRREHRDDTRPVLGLELLGRVDDDEADGARGVDGRDYASEMQDGGAGAGGGERGVGGDVGSALEEGFDVRHAEKGGGGGRDEDDWVGASAGFGVEREGGGARGARLGGPGFATDEGLGDFADVGEVLLGFVSLLFLG